MDLKNVIIVVIFIETLFELGYSQNTTTMPIQPADPTNPFKFQSTSARSLHGVFLKKVIDIILDKGLSQPKQLEKLPFLSPQQLRNRFDFTLGEESTSQDKLLELIEILFDIMVKPFPANRMSRRVAGLDPLALVGDWMAVTMNNLVITYQDAPIWIFMEITIIRYLSKQIGWSETGQGIPTSGAGMANSMAMAVALRNLDPKVRDIGLFHIKKKLTIYVSTGASISWKTAAIFDGIGLEGIVEVTTDIWGRMDPLTLDILLTSDRLDKIPVMVVATAGTPILGVIDPIAQIAAICARHNVWLHVDAEMAGGYLFTSKNRKFRQTLAGISRANSVSVSMWLFQAPYPSSMLLTRDPRALEKTFGLHANYVFDTIGIYNASIDQGDNTIQTSRRPEISKIWFAASRGEKNSFELFELMEQTKSEFLLLLYRSKGFVPVKASPGPIIPQLPLISFYYEPKVWIGRNGQPDYIPGISSVTKAVVKELRKQGLLDISLSVLPNEPTLPAFFTISFTNTRVRSNLFEFIISTIQKIAEGELSGHTFPDIGQAEEKSSLKYPNFPLKERYQDFFKGILNIAFKTGIFFSRKDPALNFQQPELFDGTTDPFDFSLPYSKDHKQLLQKLTKGFETIIKYSPHTAHPYYVYHLETGLDPYTIVADYISPVLNTPMITYYDSGPFMLMERELVKNMIKRIYGKDGGDGIFTDGGSMANQIAITLAKYQLDGEGFKNQGIRKTNGKKYIIYTSWDAHYSTKKGAMIQGIGQNNTVEIEANVIGKMNVDNLKKEIEKTKREGNIPLMVVITTGTTIYGAIDPIDAIVDVCKQYKIWCHADGAFGGLISMSDKHIKKYKGIERTDSWNADLHKLMGSTQTCTILITSQEGLFKKVFQLIDENQEEPYLEGTPELNQVGRHVQLDKRNNIFKFWLLWKAKGRKGLGAHVDKIMSNKDFLIAEIKRREKDGFELILDNYELTNVCFIYIPQRLRGMDRNSTKWKREMTIFANSIEEVFVRNGILLFVTQAQRLADGSYSIKFIKFVMMGSSLTHADIRFLLDAVAYYGSQIKESTVKPQTAGKMNHCEQFCFDPFGNLPIYYPVN